MASSMQYKVGSEIGMETSSFVEIDKDKDTSDPDATPIRDRRVVTQPYDLAIDAIISQVNSNILFLRPLSSRPNFQRQYVWSDVLASKLVESVLLNVPIPPCYLSENEENELDVIDGQQRIYSIYRFAENQFKLSNLEALTELNGKRFFELSSREQRKILTHTLRCVVITNELHPEIKFDVFERLNTNTVPLNSQELRNCIYRGALNDVLNDLSFDERWLAIRKKKAPDKRLADEELILRFFAYELLGLESYKTPLKGWLNDAAKSGRRLTNDETSELKRIWDHCLNFVLEIFEPTEAFRRPSATAINRALFDLIMSTAAKHRGIVSPDEAGRFREALKRLAENEEFDDLISRAVDHKKRTRRRFVIWHEEMQAVFD